MRGLVALDVEAFEGRQKLQPAQVGIVGGRVFRAAGRNGRLFLWCQVQLQGIDNLARYLILQRKDVGHGAIVALRPDVAAGRAIDQLGVDAHSVLDAPHGALQNVGHAEFPRHLSQIMIAAAILKRAIAGNHEKTGNF